MLVDTNGINDSFVLLAAELGRPRGDKIAAVHLLKCRWMKRDLGVRFTRFESI